MSRMPCLSHLYTQLNYLQSQESSIFVRGVNPEKTYYMVNPDNNLPNAESVFKDWFERWVTLDILYLEFSEVRVKGTTVELQWLEY